MNRVLMILSMLLTAVLPLRAQNGVAVNQSGAVANDYAILDVSSTTKGLLIPRMTQAQIGNVDNPVNGLMVFNTDDDKLYIFLTSDNTWKPVAYAWDIVTNPATNKTWLDRNLGAAEVATGKTDDKAYGDLYQWGRFADGHEKRNSSTTSTKATTPDPYGGNSWDGKFIKSGSSPYDWLDAAHDLDNTLWQGVNGTNNPCPPGFRLPTETELDNERGTWATNDDDGAYNSPLKFTLAGRRLTPDASLSNVGTDGYYWSSSVSGNSGRALHFNSSNANMSNRRRALGASVRCIED